MNFTHYDHYFFFLNFIAIIKDIIHGSFYQKQTLCDKVCQWIAAGRWFSPVSSTKKTDRYDIAEILLKVA